MTFYFGQFCSSSKPDVIYGSISMNIPNTKEFQDNATITFQFEDKIIPSMQYGSRSIEIPIILSKDHLIEKKIESLDNNIEINVCQYIKFKDQYKGYYKFNEIGDNGTFTLQLDPNEEESVSCIII